MASPHSTLRRDLIFGAAIAVTYCLAALLGLRWAILPGAGTPVWPAAGIAFAGLVLGGSRLWPSIVIGRVAAAVIVNSPVPMWSDVLVGVATMLGAYVPVLLLERRGGLDRRLGSVRDMVWLVVGGGLSGAVISASLGVASLWLGGIPTERLLYAWFNWACGYFVGVITAGPLLLSWSVPQSLPIRLRSWVHFGVCLGFVAILAEMSFLYPEVLAVRSWHLLPVLIWAALAFRMPGTSAALAIVSVFAILGAIHGAGPMGSDDAVARVFLTQPAEFSLKNNNHAPNSLKLSDDGHS